MKVGLDLDNVIVDIVASARTVIAADIGIDPEHIIDTNIYWDPFTHRDEEIAQRLKPDHAFWDRQDLLLNAPELPGSLQAARSLHEAGILTCFITRRPPIVELLTARWLHERNYPQVPVIHVGNTDEVHYFKLCKSSACQTYEVTHMVDDQAHEVETLIKAGIKAILVDAPIGQQERQQFIAQHPHVPVVPSVVEAAQMLLEEYAQMD